MPRSFRPKSPSAARSANVTPGTDIGPGSGFDPRTPGAGRTQSFRQPITEHQIVFGRCRTSGPVVFLHSATDDEGRADGFLHVVVVLAAHRVRAIGEERCDIDLWQLLEQPITAQKEVVPRQQPAMCLVQF